MDNENLDKYKVYIEPEKEPVNAPEPPKKKRKVLLPVILAVVVLITAVFVTGFAFKDDIKNIVSPTTTTRPEDNPNTVRITFPEGYTVYQYAQLLEENGVCSKKDFYAAVNTPVEGINITNADERVFLLEGYLFPDTYDFYLNEEASSVVGRFIENYRAKITPEIEQKATQLGYTMDEMLTLASIIQKECDFDISECQTVSSVFHNRLNNSRETYLGSDVTYFYLKNMKDYLGGSDSEKFDLMLTKYYTYNNYRKGLPSGAICNPGLKAITAAVSPADTDYYYFLTDAEGKNFYYAETYAQHLKNGKTAGIMD